MNRKKFSILILSSLILITSLSTSISAQVNNKEVKNTSNICTIKQDSDDNMVYAGGSKYFNEVTGKYTIKGTIKSIDNTEKNPELAGESRLIVVKTADKEFTAFISILTSKIIGGYENIKEGANIEITGNFKNNVLVAEKVVIEDHINLIKELTDFKVIEHGMPNNKELSEWVRENSNTEGIYHKKYNNKDYIIIAAGECNSGGYSIKVNELFLKEDNLYIDAKIQSPPENANVTMSITYPYVLVELNSTYNFNDVIWNQLNNDFEINDSTTLGDIKTKFNSADDLNQKLDIVKEVLNFLQGLFN